MMNFQQMINKFWNHVSDNNIEIYNEFSLQFELGIFLRNRTELMNYKIQFERNISHFGVSGSIAKREIDLVIFSHDQSEKYAIELKFPKNGQVPEQMYCFVKDIVFVEQLKSSGFTDTYTLVVVDDKKFYEGKSTGIYSYFRNTPKSIAGKIYKPTGPNKGIKYLDVRNSYPIQWEDCCLGKFFLIRAL